MYRERGAIYERKEKKGDMFGEEGIMMTHTERKGSIWACTVYTVNREKG